MYSFYSKQTFPYTIGAVIGKGTFGTVYEAKHAHTGAEYAMKVVHKRTKAPIAHRELQIHMRLSDLHATGPIEEVIDD